MISPEQITTGVSDVYETESGAGEQDRGECAAHSVEIGIVGNEFGNRLVALIHGITQLRDEVLTGFVVVQGGK